MKFGMFYEIQVPKPWTEDTEFDTYQQVLDQVQLADEIGYDSFWTVEHHFFRGVLTLFGTRSAVRCGQPADQKYSYWSRCGVVALSV